MKLTQIFKLVSELFGREDYTSSFRIRKAPRAYFKVTDHKKALELRQWAYNRYHAEQKIGRCLRKMAGVIGGETPSYKTDENGYVSYINYQYSVPWTHEGWKGFNNTNWLQPDSSAVKKKLKSLPPLPSISKINKIINFPEANTNPLYREMSTPGYKKFARIAMNQTRVSLKGEDVYISVLYPEAFNDSLDLKQKIQEWSPPNFLQAVEKSEGKRAEKLYIFSQSPLGHIIAKGLRFIASPC